MQKKITLSLFLSIVFFQLFSQQLNFPLTNDYVNDYEKSLYAPNNNFHTAIKPWLASEVNKVVNTDSVKNNYSIKSEAQKKFFKTVHNKIFNESLIDLKKDNCRLTIDPVFNFSVGAEFEKNYNDTTFTNTRGFQAEGSIGNKFSFFTTFYENQSYFTNYLDSNIRSTTVVPGQGLTKPFKSNGFDYAWASAYISYTPSKYVNFQLGHGKNFIGDGYRSLLLSDNSFNYPYLKITTNLWKLKYILLYAAFEDLQSNYSNSLGYKKKYGVFHYLSYSVNKRLEVGLFEAVIWKNADSTGYRGVELNYLDPVIFYRPVEYSLGSPDNCLMGLNVSYKIRKHNVFYGQLLIDDCNIHDVLAGNGWWGNKQAFQLGIKSFDLFNIKNLYFQTEFNYARPYTYSHESSQTNYAQYNQSLADPLGANFMESVTFLKYNYKRFFVEFKFNYAVYGADTGKSDYGQNIFIPYMDRPKANGAPEEYGVYTLQGVRTTLIYKDFKVSYLVNPSTNFNIYFEVTDRTRTSSLLNVHSMYFSFGLRTSLNNFYYDF